MLSKKEVVQALSMCQDPELGANIVDIGLIQGISVGENNDVKVTLTMTSAMCPVTSIILADVQLRLESLPGIGKVDVDLVWDPMWSPEMMSDELKYRS
ncbi:metal-sulfur cluster assembly factor [Candidatus Marsarchaeota archaeon]|jgi:metal-sulfur cluster biosynthetic enzyme|nr:metal-sulfur cluster assembly factor [Candidatus Marsarchaeota archaeon]MCL5115450.1 metal-sulfur cluster assembly factor [Candidatus Marsarchaeota archaeon]